MTHATSGPRFLYLHGFASGKDSKKGVELSRHLAERGLFLERLDLRVPSFRQLRVSEMIKKVREAIGTSNDRAVLFGSSLGGFVAAQVAAEDPRVCALVLLAPAFNLAARWKQRLGEDGFRKWRESGFLQTLDHTTGKTEDVDFGFFEDFSRIDEGPQRIPNVPTLIFHGRQDDVVDIKTSEEMAAGRQHIRLVPLEDGHELVASLPRIKQECEPFLFPFLKEQPKETRRAYSVAVYPRYKGRLLLIRHRRLDCWLPPGGECHLGELPSDAAARELQEETGLVGTFPVTSDITGTPAGLIGYEEHQAGKKGLHLNFVFVADVATDKIAPNSEFDEWRWVTLSDPAFEAAPRNVYELAVVALNAPPCVSKASSAT